MDLAEIEELRQAIDEASGRQALLVRENSNLRAKLTTFAKREAERLERKRRRAETRANARRRTCFFGCMSDDCLLTWVKDFLEGEPEFQDPTRYAWNCKCGSGISWIALAEDSRDAQGLAEEARSRIAEFENGDYSYRSDQLEALRANKEIDESAYDVVSGLLEAAAQAYDGGSECRSEALDRRIRRELFRSLLQTTPTDP